MTEPNILIVEDEHNIAEVLIAYSLQQGFNTKHFDNGNGVVEFVKLNTVDLILLDVMLPEINGIELCQQIRAISDVPIIMLTAKSEEADRLLGLELGADDYICKPFSPKEVIARMKAVLKRVNSPKRTVAHYLDFELNKNSYVALLQGKNLGFTAVEFKIFSLFLNQIGRVFSREDIINAVYSDAVETSDRNIDTHIKNIRKKINQIDAQLHPISAVYGVGYKFE
ncbi:Transcriptional regulatory protein BaeR [Paraglaciecola mesophila]|uniref:Transcriptional regulatory protein BaeR n=1 Tax=Paraglaciecola mesophila TaxID=197222 RepID=A0A857JJS7_9ALTE|nr:response regulator [Paraglaciecola mesophila]QHJ11562.1 Transcriptional regulatory protein BaeR [Paraglaciecola mesophila]